MIINMQKDNIELEVVNECIQLLEKSCFPESLPVFSTGGADLSVLENTLVAIKTLNARYDRHEAISQIQAIMQHYNIQIDELMDKHRL
jgi:hypothetical protein